MFIDVQEPKVSIITPLHNSSSFIRETLDSVLAQTYLNWESLLIDDGSIDGTASMVEPFLADARFKYIPQEHRGIADARNTGLAAATGEWICLLDHDDRWRPDKLEKQLRYALARACDIVCSDALIVEHGSSSVMSRAMPEITAELRQSEFDSTVDLFELLIKGNFICACSVMVRKSLFDEHGVFDPDAAPADDYDMWLRCMPDAKVGYVDEPLVHYMIHAGNHSRNEVRMLEKASQVLIEHRRRHAGDPARVRQFNQGLVLVHGCMFRKWMDRRLYGRVFWRTGLLILKGHVGREIFALVPPFLAQLGDSIRREPDVGGAPRHQG